MSSSVGTPSKKLGWYKSLLGKIKHENHLLELAKKGQKPENMSKKWKVRFGQLQELANELKRKEQSKENKKQKEKSQ